MTPPPTAAPTRAAALDALPGRPAGLRRGCRSRWRPRARWLRVTGLVLEAAGVRVPVGSVCEVRSDGQPPVLAEVVGFNGDRAFLMPTGELHGLASGARVVPRAGAARAAAPGRATTTPGAAARTAACTCRWATACSAASSTRTASRWTAAARSPACAPSR
ncbi:MAG: hypothetical protein MZW92_18610 [Comamonadaceae bacterium]|nr:hypothetical protein [Comamonadaceae bacterium]